MMTFSKNRIIAIAVTFFLAIAAFVTALCTTVRADGELTVQSYSLFTQPGRVNGVDNTTCMWELDIEFSVTATSDFVDGAPDTVPDTASKVADITVNGVKMGDIFNCVYRGSFPSLYQFAYIQWVKSSSNNRLLKLYLPVNLYDYTAFTDDNPGVIATEGVMGYKGDGTDVIVLPEGLALPNSEGTLAQSQTLNVTSDKVSGNETSIIKHVKLDQITGDSTANMSGWLYLVPVMNVAATYQHNNCVELTSRYADYVYLNGVSVMSMNADGVNFKISYWGTDFIGQFSESINEYGASKQYLFAFDSKHFKKDGTDVLVIKKGFTPLTGVTLNKDYVYSITFDMSKDSKQKATFTEIDNVITEFEQVSTGTAELGGAHNLPSTVNAVYNTGEKVALPVTWGWTNADQTPGAKSNVGTVNAEGYNLMPGLSNKITATVNVMNLGEIAIESYNLSPAPTTIAEVENTSAMWEVDVVFNVAASVQGYISGAPAETPDTTSKVSDITINGKTMTELFNYVYRDNFPSQYRFAYIEWNVAQNGNRLLKLFLPVNLYDYTAYPNVDLRVMGTPESIMGFKGDGTDVIVLPEGLALPNFEGTLSQAQTLNATADKVSNNTTTVLKYSKLDQIAGDSIENMSGWLYFVPLMKVTATQYHDYNIVHLTSRYADYVYLNGASVMSMNADGVNMKVSYWNWDDSLTEPLGNLGYLKQYTVGFESKHFKKDGTDVLVFKKGFTPLTGITLDRDYAYAITFDMSKGEEHKATITEVVNRIDSFEKISAGSAEMGGAHNLPSTVTAVLATGDTVTLPVTWEWTNAGQTPGPQTNVGTVDLGEYNLIAGLTNQITATVQVAYNKTLQATGSALSSSTVKLAGKDINAYKITVVFDETATADGGDAFEEASGVKINGLTLAEIKNSLSATWQSTVTCNWTVSDGKRALEITVPVCAAIKNDGTDVVTLPQGLAVPEYNSLAQEVTLSAMQGVAKTASIIDIGVLNEINTPDDGPILRSYYTFYVAISLPSQGQLQGLELESEYANYVYINNQTAAAYYGALAGTVFMQANTNPQHHPNLMGENGVANGLDEYNNECFILVFGYYGGYMKNTDGSYIKNNIIEFKEGLALALGFTLDKDYTYVVRLSQDDGTVSDTLAFIEDTGKAVKSVNLPTRVAVGKELPTTVVAETLAGSTVTLNATADWQKKDEVGTYSVTYTVANDGNYMMLDGSSFTFTYGIEVYDYISSFETLTDKTCDYGSSFNSLGLPATVTAITATGGSVTCDVEWQSSGFDGNVSGEQTITGTVFVPVGVEVGDGVSLEVTVKVTVAAAPEPKKVITSIGAISDPDSIKIGEKHNLPTKVTAQLNDGTSVELSVAWTWSTATQVGKISVTGTVSVGEYELGEGVSATIVKEINVIDDVVNENKGGCGGNVAFASTVTVALLVSACAIILMRKKNNV